MFLKTILKTNVCLFSVEFFLLVLFEPVEAFLVQFRVKVRWYVGHLKKCEDSLGQINTNSNENIESWFKFLLLVFLNPSWVSSSASGECPAGQTGLTAEVFVTVLFLFKGSAMWGGHCVQDTHKHVWTCVSWSMFNSLPAESESWRSCCCVWVSHDNKTMLDLDSCFRLLSFGAWLIGWWVFRTVDVSEWYWMWCLNI